MTRTEFIGYLLIAYGAGCWSLLIIWLLTSRLTLIAPIMKLLQKLKPGDSIVVPGGIYIDKADENTVHGNKVYR